MVTTNLKEAGGKHGAYEQKLHISGMTRVMLQNKQKAQHCTDCHQRKCRGYINGKRYTYPGRSDTNLSEVRDSAEEETTFRVQKIMNDW